MGTQFHDPVRYNIAYYVGAESSETMFSEDIRKKVEKRASLILEMQEKNLFSHPRARKKFSSPGIRE